MPEEKPTDDVEKVLADLKGIEGRKQALIDDLLQQREAAMKAFDEKLAKLGYHANSHRSKRSHHKKVSATDAKKEAKSKAPPAPTGDGPGKVNAPTVPRRRS